VIADLPLETEKMWLVAALAMLDALHSDAGFDINLQKKKHQAGSGIAVCQFSRVPFWHQ
jgi:hypothetical protein